MSGTIPTEVVRAAVDAVGLLKARELIGESKPDQEISPAVTRPTIGAGWYVRRGLGGSRYWHVSSRERERIAVAEREEDARLIATAPELLEFAQQLAKRGIADAPTMEKCFALIAKATLTTTFEGTV